MRSKHLRRDADGMLLRTSGAGKYIVPTTPMETFVYNQLIWNDPMKVKLTCFIEVDRESYLDSNNMPLDDSEFVIAIVDELRDCALDIDFNTISVEILSEKSK